MLSDQLNKELQAIFIEEYGFHMQEEDAAKAGIWLATYFDALSGTQEGEIIEQSI